MRTAGGSQRAAWGASVQRWMQDAPTAAAGRAEGAAPPVAARSSSGAHLEAPPRQGGRPVLPPLAPGQPPGAHSWRGPPQARTPGASGHPHLENRTVPCSSGLRLTARQLCRISSGSGRSILAQGHGKQGWDPPGAGTVTARAAPSPG